MPASSSAKRDHQLIRQLACRDALWTNNYFLGRARRSRDGLMDSRLHHRYRAGPPPPPRDPPPQPYIVMLVWCDHVMGWGARLLRRWSVLVFRICFLCDVRFCVVIAVLSCPGADSGMTSGPHEKVLQEVCPAHSGSKFWHPIRVPLDTHSASLTVTYHRAKRRSFAPVIVCSVCHFLVISACKQFSSRCIGKVACAHFLWHTLFR